MSQRGFTLLELLMVVAIMSIIAAVTLVRTDLLQSDAEINSAGQQIINMAKRARQQSISVSEYEGIFPSYGLYFDTSEPNQFIIYANCIPDDNGDGKVDHDDNFGYNDLGHSDCHNAINDAGGSSPGPTTAATVEVVELENRAKIKNIEIKIKNETPVSGLESVSVNYLRPEPTVWIAPIPQVGTEKIVPVGYVKITIMDKAERYEKDIYFYTSALVETSLRSPY
jgi:prepilin-type N-terminal cleavage/methylation domain-containing protein